MVTGTLALEQRALSDDRLVDQAKRFSQDAWAQIYDAHYPKLFQYCYLRVADRSAAQDLASEVFLEALRGIQGYRYRGVPLSAWLYRIARNVTADYIDGRVRRPVERLPDDANGAAFHLPDEAMQSALAQDVYTAIGQLTNEQQQVIMLRFFQGLSHEETAAAMGKRSGAVRALQNRALQSLRRLLQRGSAEVA